MLGIYGGWEGFLDAGSAYDQRESGTNINTSTTTPK